MFGKFPMEFTFFVETSLIKFLEEIFGGFSGGIFRYQKESLKKFLMKFETIFERIFEENLGEIPREII